MTNYIEINGERIGPGYPTYIIAEMSSNHNQDFEQAVALVKAAKEAGANAIKLQTSTPDTLTIDSDRPEFRISSGTIWDGQTLYQLYEKAYTPWEWQPRLKALADDLGLHCFSSPFSYEAVDFLQQMGVPAFKIASFELVDIPLIEYIAKQGKPIIISTGMSVLMEIDESVRTAQQAGATQLALLKCNSAYPAPPEEMNLRTIPHMAEMFNVPVGLSDHTHGSAIAITAVALGACIVEKHLTLSRSIHSLDSSFSMEPNEFKDMVQGIRIAEKSLGRVCYGPTPKEQSSRACRRSLFVVEDMKAGKVFTDSNVRSIRPANGIAPKFLKEVLGRRAACDIEKGTPLKWSLICG